MGTSKFVSNIRKADRWYPTGSVPSSGTHGARYCFVHMSCRLLRLTGSMHVGGGPYASYTSVAYPASSAFDNDPTTFWMGPTIVLAAYPHTLSFNFYPSNYTIEQYTIMVCAIDFVSASDLTCYRLPPPIHPPLPLIGVWKVPTVRHQPSQDECMLRIMCDLWQMAPIGCGSTTRPANNSLLVNRSPIPLTTRKARSCAINWRSLETMAPWEVMWPWRRSHFPLWARCIGSLKSEVR